MLLRDLIAVLDRIAPTGYAEPWDNVGLLAGDVDQPVTRAMLCIDYTAAVADEARDERCDLVIAYHPPIFTALKRVTGLVHDAIRRGVAIYSPHTAWDAADGGTNDVLADAVGMAGDRQPLKVSVGAAIAHKLVTFVPAEALARVSDAIFAAGAGRIGNYSSCSFRNEGTGTFFGDEGTNPAVGQSGRLETSPEVRIETVVPFGKVEAVVRALRQAHPYEEPAFDLNTLAAPPTGRGMGRVGAVSGTAAALVDRLKRAFELPAVLVAGDLERTVTKAAVCAGACGELLDDAIKAGVEVYVTGEMRHHDVLRGVAAGLTVVCTLHSNSERASLTRLQGRLAAEAPGPAYLLSRRDRDPFSVR